eukprot:COSAG02_NODE_4938_length_4811_cov_23.006791_6_plen_52_part_00
MLEQRCLAAFLSGFGGCLKTVGARLAAGVFSQGFTVSEGAGPFRDEGGRVF